MILSPIEQSIKRKIEEAGTPLKDWDINIYRGILTGYNEAFIIDGKKKDELIAEDPKSAEIIRPILRGRDIKRYGYDFADLWLINSHNGIKEKGIKPINIDDFPAIKKHLDKYYFELSKRADKGETLYNLRNCAYMDDFSKPKIIWKRVGSILKFCYDENGTMALDSTCFATGIYMKFLVCFMNSSIGNYLLLDSPKTGTGDLLISVQAVEPIVVPLPSDENLQLTNALFELALKEDNVNSKINNIFYNIFEFTEEEIQFIEEQIN